jgi:hypothetical protein
MEDDIGLINVKDDTTKLAAHFCLDGQLKFRVSIVRHWWTIIQYWLFRIIRVTRVIPVNYENVWFRRLLSAVYERCRCGCAFVVA